MKVLTSHVTRVEEIGCAFNWPLAMVPQDSALAQKEMGGSRRVSEALCHETTHGVHLLQLSKRDLKVQASEPEAGT